MTEVHFNSLDIDVSFKPLSIRQSKILNANFKIFVASLPKAGNDVEAQDSAAADFLTNQVDHLLHLVYQQDIKDLEDRITLQDSIDFMKAQVNACGKSDFLVQPIGALIQSLEAALEQMEDRVAEAVAQV